MNAVLPIFEARRAKAAETFRARGVPHRRIEEWKYSDLRTALDEDAVSTSGAAPWTLGAIPNGCQTFDLADFDHDAPDWVSRNLGTLGAGAMDAASLAFAAGGLALRVSQPTTAPVRLGFSGGGHARLLIVIEPGASLTLVETQSQGAGLRNIGTEVVLGAQARLEHIRLADEASELVSIASIAVVAESGAEYRAHFTNFGARLSRVDANIVLKGEGASAHLSGVDVLHEEGHADVTTHVDHAVGNTRSTQLFKKVAGDKARSIYQGKVTVRAGANGSDSRQTAKGLLLGERAEIDLKPELEIFADDVKCAHGAAVGDLDADSLFYLRARGVPETDARNMLVHAFVVDALEGVSDEALRFDVWTRIEMALKKAGAA
jgi:Fe-S cluster assembly protein SufD